MVKEKWLEILSISMTAIFMIAGFAGLSRLAEFAATCCISKMGFGLAAPTQYVIDIAYGPISLERLPTLLPIAVAMIGAKLKQGERQLLATTMLVIAPQLVLLGLIASLLALWLPFLSISY